MNLLKYLVSQMNTREYKAPIDSLVSGRAKSNLASDHLGITDSILN